MEGGNITNSNIKAYLQLFKVRASSFSDFNSDCVAQTNKQLRNGVVNDILRSLKLLFRPSTDGIASADIKEAWDNATTRAEILFYISYRTQLLDNEVKELINVVKGLSERLDDIKLDADANSGESGVLLNTFVFVQLALIRALQQTEKLMSREVDYLSINHLHQESDFNACERKEIGMKEWHGIAEPWLNIGARGLICIALAIFRQPDAEEDERASHEVKGLLVKASLCRGYSYLRECVLPVIHGIALVDFARSTLMMETIAAMLSSLAKIFVTGQYRGHELREDFAFELFYRRTDTRSSSHHINSTQQEEFDSFATFVLLFADFLECYPSFASQFWDVQKDVENLMQLTDESVGHHPFLIKTIDLCGNYDYLYVVGLRFVSALARSGSSLSPLVIYKFMSERLLWRWCVEHVERAYDVLYKVDAVDGLPSSTATDASGSVLKSAINKAMQMSSMFRNNVLEPEVLRQEDIVQLHFVVQFLAAISRHAEVAAMLVEEFQLLDRLFIFISSAITVDVKASCLDCLSSICRHDRSYVERIWQLCEQFSLFPVRSVGSNIAEKGFAWEFAEIEVRSERFPMTMSFLSLLSEMLKFGIPHDLGTGYRIPGITAYVDFVVDEVLLKAQSRVYDRSMEEVDSLGQRWKVTSLALEVVQCILASYPLELIHSFSRETSQYNDLLADFSDQETMYIVDKKEIFVPRAKSPGFVLLASILSNSQLTELLMNVLIYLDQGYIEHQTVEFLNALLSSTKSKLFNDFSTNPMYVPGSLSLTVVESGVVSRLKTSSNVTLQRTNSVFWIERTIATSLWILNDIAKKEETFFKFHELNGRPIVIPRQDQGRFMPTPVTPTSLTSLLVGNDAVVSLIYLVTQQFAFLPVNPPIELLALRLVQYVIINAPDYHLCAPRLSDSRKRLHDVTDIVRKFNDILLYDDKNDQNLLNAIGQYVLVVDRSALTPLVWSSVTPHNSDMTSVYKDMRDIQPNLVRAEILNLFLKALQSHRVNLIHQLLGMSVTVGNTAATAAFTRRPCLFSIVTLLNPRDHQLLLHSPSEAVDCYELIYRLCVSDVSAVYTAQMLRDHTVEFFHSQFEFFAYVIQNRRYIPSLHITAVANGFAWFLKTFSLELFRREQAQERETVAQLLQYIYGSASTNVSVENSDGNSVFRLLPTVQMMMDGFVNARSTLFMQLTEQNIISQSWSRDAKGGIGFEEKNPFRNARNDPESVEPPEFFALSLKDAVLLLRRQAQTQGHTLTQEQLDQAIQTLTESNSNRRLVASLQHLALSIKQVVELSFFTSCFTVMQEEGLVAFDGGASDIIGNMVQPLLTMIRGMAEYDTRSAELLVDMVIVVLQCLDKWSDMTDNGAVSMGKVNMLQRLSKELFLNLQSGQSRGSIHHAKISLALLHLRRFLQRHEGYHQHHMTIWNEKGDANVVIERLLDVVVLSPQVRWKIVALNFLKSFYEDMTYSVQDGNAGAVVFRGKDAFSRLLISRKRLGNVINAIFPLEENQLEARVELLSAFNDLVASICEDLPSDLLTSEVLSLIALLADKPDFESLQLQLLNSTFSYSYSSVLSDNENVLKERRHTLMRGFLSVVDVLTHVVHCSSLGSDHHRLLEICLMFYQRNVQIIANILRMQYNEPATITGGLEVVTAFLAAVTAKHMRLETFTDMANNSLYKVKSWADLWGPGSEIVLMDIFKLLQILGDSGLSHTGDSRNMLELRGSLRPLGEGVHSSLGTMDALSVTCIFGKVAESLVFRDEIAGVQGSVGGVSSGVMHIEDTNLTGKPNIFFRTKRLCQVLRCAEHCTVFVRAAIQSTAFALKQQQHQQPHSSTSVAPVKSLSELLLRVVSLPAVTSWIHHCLEALLYLSRGHSQSNLQEGYAGVLHECITRILENLLCVVYCLVNLQQQQHPRHLSAQYQQQQQQQQQQRVALDLQAMRAVEQVMRDASALPAQSFARVVIRWLKELIE